MDQPATLSKLIDAVRLRFPRASDDWLAQISSNAVDWTDSLSKEFPYWFLAIEPGDLLSTATWPLNLSTLPTRGPAGSRWVDSGFLVTTPGQAVYDFYHPTDYEAYKSNPTDPLAFSRCSVQQVDYVIEFNATSGSFRTILECREMCEALGFGNYSQNTRPVQCMWRSTETKSQIIFQPTPQDYYLYSIGFVLRRAPWYQMSGSVDYFNRWLTFAPECLVLYALTKACEFFNEPTMLQMFQMQLNGNPPKAGRSYGSSNQYVGELGRLKRDTARKREAMFKKIEWYESQAEAQRQGQGLLYPGPQSRLRFILPQYRRGIY